MKRFRTPLAKIYILVEYSEITGMAHNFEFGVWEDFKNLLNFV